MPNVNISWVKFIIGREGLRAIYVLEPLGSENSEWDDEERVEKPYIGLIENNSLVAYSPVPEKYRILLYSEGFRRIARDYIDGKTSYMGVLKYFKIDIEELKRSSRIKYPEKDEEFIVLDNALLMVLDDEMIAVLGGEKTLYLRASKSEKYLEYIPGIPPKKPVEDEIRTSYELVGVINSYPRPKVEYKELIEKTDTISIIESYPMEYLLLYTAFKDGDTGYVKKTISRLGSPVPYSETLTTTEIEVLKKLINKMKEYNIGDWKTLQVATAISILFDRDLDEVYNYLLGKYVRKVEEF